MCKNMHTIFPDLNIHSFSFPATASCYIWCVVTPARQRTFRDQLQHDITGSGRKREGHKVIWDNKHVTIGIIPQTSKSLHECLESLKYGFCKILIHSSFIMQGVKKPHSSLRVFKDTLCFEKLKFDFNIHQFCKQLLGSWYKILLGSRNVLRRDIISPFKMT